MAPEGDVLFTVGPSTYPAVSGQRPQILQTALRLPTGGLTLPDPTQSRSHGPCPAARGARPLWLRREPRLIWGWLQKTGTQAPRRRLQSPMCGWHVIMLCGLLRDNQATPTARPGRSQHRGS